MTYKQLMQFIQTADFCAQSAHFFAGATIALLGALFWDSYYYGFLILQLWAIPKELIFDKLSIGEGHDSPDYLDLFFYELGGGLASLIIFFRYMLLI